ncbi:hypothetical protein ANCCEY_08107 [Ancylostoma ceylanicum]|uniref:Pre-mRNA-splicing factor SPF27 n=1 Tax=Ancylostoma ceylanicum TaxID=53326 RepID=A0A0D6LYW8_9BILA|nr:hypothetical protein ANCCEY_08107 [Ancylostoma ceylanicum]
MKGVALPKASVNGYLRSVVVTVAHKFQVLVDALPYLDTEYNDADRQTALRLIDQECKVMEIHARRKMAQLDAGRQLKELEGSWVAMVTNNYRFVSII